MLIFIVGTINLIIKALGSVLSMIIGLLPDSPFLLIENINIPYLSYFNWLIPVNKMIVILSYWLVAIGLYYVVSVVLRWTKAIS